MRMENAVRHDHSDLEKEQKSKQKMFDDLYDLHKSDVFNFAFYLTKNQGEAEDLFQDTWLRVAKNFPQTLHMDKVKSWIFTITSNLYKDLLRKKKVRKSFLSKRKTQAYQEQHSFLNSFSSDAYLNQDSSEQAEMGYAISQALDQLPEQHRHVFILKEMAGFKHSEISEILDLPEGTVKSVLFRAVKKLRQHLQAYSPEQLKNGRR
ncbi:MAG: sigma-70 family RNA polymerase sigma factor [Candidatus Aminicenantes bacterium]|nr:sigma-70 family RNA polymerase sigma factor [Candidatus Aminicenantes bacterium]